MRNFLIVPVLIFLGLAMSAPAHADNLKKLQKKYDYVSEPTSCGKVVAGDKGVVEADISRGDKGLRLKGVVNAQVVTIQTRQAEPLGYDVALRNQRHGGDGDIFRILPLDKQVPLDKRKVGLLDLCKGVLIAPQFAKINKFSDDGYAVAITNTDYTILDQAGNEMLQTRFRHGVTPDKFNAVVQGAKIFKWMSFKSKVPGSLDGRQWGLYDIPGRRFVSPTTYDEIDFIEFDSDNDAEKSSFFVRQGGKQSALDPDTGALRAPFIFSNYKNIRTLNGQPHIFGHDTATTPQGQKNDAANAYNTVTKSYILPRGDVFYDLLSENGNGPDHNGRWVVGASRPVTQKDGTKKSKVTHGVFDQNQRRFLIDFVDPAIGRLHRVGDTEFYVAEQSVGNTAALFDAVTGKRVTGFHKNVNHGRKLNLNSGGRTYPLYIVENKLSHLFWLYDGNRTLVYVGQGGTDDWAKTEGDIFVFTERVSRQNTKKVTTCMDKNYQIIGEPKTCVVDAVLNGFNTSNSGQPNQAVVSRPKTTTLTSTLPAASVNTAVMARIGDVNSEDARKAFFKAVPKKPKKKNCATAEWEKIGFRQGFKLDDVEKRRAKLVKTCGASFDADRFTAGFKEGRRMVCGHDLGLRDGRMFHSTWKGNSCPDARYPSYVNGYEIGKAYSDVYKEERDAYTVLTEAEKELRRLEEVGASDTGIQRQEKRVNKLEADYKTKKAAASRFAAKYHIDHRGGSTFLPDAELEYEIPSAFP